MTTSPSTTRPKNNRLQQTRLRGPALAIAALAATALLVTGCSTGSSDSAATSSDSGATADESTGESFAESASGDVGAGSRQRGAELAQSPAVISTGVVSLRTDDADASRAEVLKVVDVHQGQVTDEETSTAPDGDIEFSRLVLRVPAEDFSVVMEELERVGDLESSNKSAEDVSVEVVDVEARIRAQQRSLRRIEVLFDRAETIRDIVSVESELNQRQGDLDALEARRGYLADQTSMATITVHLAASESANLGDSDLGFLTGLSNGWSALVGAAVVGLTVLGAMLPWLIVLGLVLAPIVWFVRRGAAAGASARSAQAQAGQARTTGTQSTQETQPQTQPPAQSARGE